MRPSVIKSNAGPRLSRRESRSCCGGWPAVHGGSQHARPGCSAEAVSRLDGAVSLARQQDRLASAQTMRGWAALARAESWCIRMQAGMPEGSSHRTSAWVRHVDWRWSGMVSLQTGRLNLRMTQRVQYSAVGRGLGALAPTSHPSPSPLGIQTDSFGARERQISTFKISRLTAMYTFSCRNT